MYTPVLTFFRIYAFNKNMHKNIRYIIKNFVRGCQYSCLLFCDTLFDRWARTAPQALRGCHSFVTGVSHSIIGTTFSFVFITEIYVSKIYKLHKKQAKNEV